MLRRTAKPPTREVISVLDIGSYKTTCLIVERGSADRSAEPSPFRVLGVGQCRSQGIKAGAVTDLSLAEEMVRAAVGRAETQAGLRIEEVVVAATCGRLASTTFAVTRPVARGRVGEADIDQLLQAAETFTETDGRALLHLHGLGFRVDDTTVVNPIGMAAGRLALDVNAVTADAGAIRNLTLLVERCYLRVAEIFAAPYASALATMTEEEARLGVTVVDMGGGTTSVAAFLDGQFVFADAIAVGGNHLTYDIARTLSTPLAEAERIKTLYATLLGSHTDGHDLVSFPVAGEAGELGTTSRARLRQIVQPRAEEILGLIRERLTRSGFGEAIAGRFVLTGGASAIVGLSALAMRELGGSVRLGSIRPVPGLPSGLATPSLAGVIGLVGLAQTSASAAAGGRPAGTAARGCLGQVSRWLRESFWDDEAKTGTSGR